MEVSRLTIDPELLSHKDLTHKQRVKLREQRIIELIRSKPSGTKIKYTEFAGAIDVTLSSIEPYLSRMIKAGRISAYPNRKGARKSYSVLEDVAVTAVFPHLEPAKIKFKSEPKQGEPTPPPATDVTIQAKEFAWQFDSDSLREFIGWYNSGRASK